MAIPVLGGMVGLYALGKLMSWKKDVMDMEPDSWDPLYLTYTVYGKLGCIWTQRQLSYFKKIGFAHKFVDCDVLSCTGIDSYPVTIDELGNQTVGYHQVKGFEWTDPSFMQPPRPPSHPADFR